MIRCLLHQTEEVIVAGLLIISLSTVGIVLGIVDELMSNILRPAEAIPLTSYALAGLSFEELSQQAELVILGNVLNQDITGAGTAGVGLENRTVSVERVLKGTYNGSTVGVISESQIAEDSPKFKQGERVILFLYKKQLFGNKPSGNDYTVVNYLQGKYEIDDKGLTGGLVSGTDTFSGSITIDAFQKKINEALSRPPSNDTKSQDEADYYANDTDLIFPNDIDLAIP